MLGMMGGNRVVAESAGGLPLDAVRDLGVRESADISALASRQDRAVAVLVWNYHDDDLPAPAVDVELSIEGLPGGRPTLTHFRVDRDHSNAYEFWKQAGSPQQPSLQQYAELEKAGQLQMLTPPERVAASGGRVIMKFSLPRQGVSLVKLTW
jgi:xylan 1,4-beta-xylosidase